MQQKYENIVDIAKSNLKKAGSKENISFEIPQTISKCCVDLTAEDLLAIKDPYLFAETCYFKLLDRPAGAQTAQSVGDSIVMKRLTREDLIRQIFRSEEYSKKDTSFMFEGDFR